MKHIGEIQFNFKFVNYYARRVEMTCEGRGERKREETRNHELRRENISRDEIDEQRQDEMEMCCENDHNFYLN